MRSQLNLPHELHELCSIYHDVAYNRSRVMHEFHEIFVHVTHRSMLLKHIKSTVNIKIHVHTPTNMFDENTLPDCR